MSNTANVIEFKASDKDLDMIHEAKTKIAAGRSGKLGAYELDEMYGYKLINKAAYIQLAIASDYGVLTNPNLSADQCRDFAERWSREPNDITASDMRKALDRLLTAQFKNEPENDLYPQLNLFS